jgi:hypothetical protein
MLWVRWLITVTVLPVESGTYRYAGSRARSARIFPAPIWE